MTDHPVLPSLYPPQRSGGHPRSIRCYLFVSPPLDTKLILLSCSSNSNILLHNLEFSVFTLWYWFRKLSWFSGSPTMFSSIKRAVKFGVRFGMNITGSPYPPFSSTTFAPSSDGWTGRRYHISDWPEPLLRWLWLCQEQHWSCIRRPFLRVKISKCEIAIAIHHVKPFFVDGKYSCVIISPVILCLYVQDRKTAGKD